MGRYIDWYLVELEGCLEGRLRSDRAHDLLCQAEAHLVETSERLCVEGMEPKASELVAIQKFGSARKIADEAIGGRRLSQGIAKFIMLASFAAFTGLASMALLGLGPSDWFVQTYLWGCGVVFLVAGMFLRRAPWRELIALGVTSWIVLSWWSGVVYPAHSLVPRGMLTSREQSLSQNAAQILKVLTEMAQERKLLDDQTYRMTQAGSPLVDGVLIFPTGGHPFRYPTELVSAKVWTGSPSFTVGVKYESTYEPAVALRGWAKSQSFRGQLNESHHRMLAGTAELERQAATTVWESTLASSGHSFLVSSIWAAGALLLSLVSTILPQLTSERTRVQRELA